MSAGDADAAADRLEALRRIPELPIEDEAKALAARFIEDGGVPPTAPADALHIAVATVQEMDYLLTWNCRHIDNAVTKPVLRSICVVAGHTCPEICTPFELLSKDWEDVP